MTPKEKAKELVDKFRIYIVTWSGGTEISNQNVKQCALIAVEELIIQQERYNNGSFYPSKYWQEVKQEIEKL